MSKVTPSTHKTRQDTRNEILDTVLESVLEAVKTAREKGWNPELGDDE